MGKKQGFKKRLNQNDKTKFCNRLWGLMIEKDIQTPQALAKELCNEKFDAHLEHSIETARKAISEHLKMEKINDSTSGLPKLQADYVIAYSRFFKCSTDYILMNINEESHELEYVKKKYGLDKNALETLSGIKGLQQLFPGSNESKFKLINLILNDERLTDSNGKALSSLLDLIIAYINFDTTENKNFWYKVNKRGISNNAFRQLDDKNISYNAKELHFTLKDMEALYEAKIFYAIKELKKQYTCKK